VPRDPELIRYLLKLADVLADAARVETLKLFRKPELDVDDKGGSAGFDPVTQADRAAEAAMRSLLARHRANDSILGEEMASTIGSSGLTWILDPIDGTRAFLAGAPSWGTLIAVADEAGPFIGLIDQPFIGERFTGTPGSAWSKGPDGRSPLSTRPPRRLEEAILFTTYPEVGSADERRAFEAVSRTVRLTRYGFDCYAYALLASGYIDLVIEAGLAPYDIAAPIAVIEAAGGLVTSWGGGSASSGGRVLAAANAEIHASALAILQGAL
jgi:histidinol phosphatase-like enzyme (inositol monophosphatase family)